MKRIKIFRAGAHLSMNGVSQAYTAADVAATAASYNPARYIAPLVVGHPAHDSPAHGSVRALFAEGGELYAEVAPTPGLVQDVADGKYLAVSSAFYNPRGFGNPSPGVWALRHVGFLGALPPAIKGLGQPAFAEGADFASFSEPLQWGDTPDVSTVSYAENPQGFHDAAMQMVRASGIPYHQAVARLHQLTRRDYDGAGVDPDSDRVHKRITAYMAAHPTTTYAQAYQALDAQGSLKELSA